MNNNDERDYAEEAANAALMREEEEGWTVKGCRNVEHAEVTCHTARLPASEWCHPCVVGIGCEGYPHAIHKHCVHGHVPDCPDPGECEVF